MEPKLNPPHPFFMHAASSIHRIKVSYSNYISHNRIKLSFSNHILHNKLNIRNTIIYEGVINTYSS
jgi:hypothetical protein